MDQRRSAPRISRSALLGPWTMVLLAAVVFGTVYLAAAEAEAGSGLQILVFTRTEGFAHGSISDGVTMIESIGTELGAGVTVTDQTDLFTGVGLEPFDVVVWLSTTGDVLDAAEEAAFQAFIQAGGGYVGIHAAADCEYGWPWYGQLLGNGAWFEDHPNIQTATLERDGASPPVGFPDPGFSDAQTSFVDEWYNFQANPRSAVQVLMTLDESSYNPGDGAMGDDHPITWAHEFDGGRAFYTGLGHRSETFEDSRFRTQILNAIQWAGGDSNTIFQDGFESGMTDAWTSVN